MRKTLLTQRLTAMAADMSGYDVADLTADSPFLSLGFDSLFLTQYAAAVQKAFGVEIAFRSLLEETPSLSSLAAHLDGVLPSDWGNEEPASGAAPSVETLDGPSVPNNPMIADAPVPNRSRISAAPTTGTATVTDSVSTFAARQSHDGVERSELIEVFDLQLQLMREQITLLSVAAPVPQTTTIAQPRAATPLVAPDAPTPPEPTKSTTPNAAPSRTNGFGPNMAAGASGVSDAQKAHISKFVKRYNARTATSKKRTQDARARFADPRTAAGFNPLWKEIVYPLVVEKSEGAHLWDVDGNQYIDILNGFGPNFFGHRAPFIVDALKAQLDDGFEVGPQTPMAGEAAALFCELTGAERVSWVNTGSEAVQAALRIARTVTGRDKVVVFTGDYHGNFDEVLVRGVGGREQRRTFPSAPGIPMASVENILCLDYGDDHALELIRAQGHEIAAVLVEPVQSRRPEFQPRAFLHALRALTEELGIVLIFDEVITGFRIAPGGAQEHFGVKADLATYGKIIGGGMPIGVVAGKARFMDTFDGGQWRYGDDSRPTAGVTFFAGTFVRHPFAIAAVHASLKHLAAAGPALQESVNRKAARLETALTSLFAERGVQMEAPRFASQLFIRVNEPDEAAQLFFYHLRDRGVHVLEGFPSYLTAAHTDEDVDAIVAAARDSILEMQADGVLPVRDGVTMPDRPVSYPLTDGQSEIWITSQMSDAASCAFNESDSISIDGALDTARFLCAARDAINAVQAFRLTISPDGASQTVNPDCVIDVALEDLSDLTAEDQSVRIEALLAKQAATPFDLAMGPLIRPTLIRRDHQRHLFILYAHHIAYDGYSSELLLNDIAARYAEPGGASALEDFELLSVQASRPAPRLAAQAYWNGQFGDAAPAPLALPVDRPWPSVRNFAGGTARGRLSITQSAAVKEMSQRIGVGRYATLFSAYGVLLSKLTAQNDLVIGVPAAGQAHHGVDAIGYGVNMLPLRVNFDPSASFSDLVKQTQRQLADGAAHQQVCVSALARDLKLPRDGRRPMLVQNVFNYSRFMSGVTFEGAQVTPIENRRRFVFHELFFNVIEADDGMAIDWDYATAILDRPTIEDWIAAYQEIIDVVCRKPDVRLADIPVNAPVARPAQDTADPAQPNPPENVATTPSVEQPVEIKMTPTEQAVAKIFEQTLGITGVAPDANFFDLGGHSVLAVRALGALRRTVSPTLALRVLFDAENVRQIAATIDAGATDATPKTDEERPIEEFEF